jgi:hypothetical protein
MDGQMLVTLEWDAKGDGKSGLPKIKRISWYKNHYTVTAQDDDDDAIKAITWDRHSDSKSMSLSPGTKPYFVFVAFNDVDFVGTPTTSLVLNECESLHQALGGWRKTNKFFAKITPFFQVDNWKEAKAVMAWLKAEGWKVGTGVAAKGFEMKGPSTAPAESLYEEIKTRVQVISGATGIPIHYLGFADVLKNRATAITLTEPMEVMALTDMMRWKGFYEALFDQAIVLRNERLNGQLQTGVVKPKMAPVTDRQFERLVKFWLPARKDGLVSSELFAQQLPGNIDVQEELKRLNQQQLEVSFGRGVDEATQELYKLASPMLAA